MPRVRAPSRLPATLAAALALTCAAAAAACPPDAGLTPIDVVQGPGTRSPLVGRTVWVEGVVTAAFLGRARLGGLFLQALRGDGNPATSEGLFVTLPSPPTPAPQPGDVLRVRGRVSEARTLTQLTALGRLVRCGTAPLPSAREVALPLGTAGWEALEGMRVRVSTPLTVNDVYDLGRYGELTLAAGRLFAPTQGAPHGGPAALGRIVLDDGSRLRDPRPVPYRLPGGGLPRDGDTVPALVGVVSTVAADVHAIEPTAPVRILPDNPRPRAPARVGGALRIATLNAHDFFTTLGDRGAATRQEYALQRDKLAAALAGLNADAVLLDEVEANGMRSEKALLDALNARLGGPRYAAVPDPPQGVGHDRIKQAILYRPAALTLVATASDPQPLFERAPVAASFRDGSGRVLTLIAVHLKSKGGCPGTGDVDRGYGCWNLRRSAQARAAVDFAGRRARAVGSPDVVVAGDLNSYAAEPPVRLLERAGYRDAAAGVPPAERYSFVYLGAAGTLDYAFLSPALASRLSGASYWHIDADESPLLAAGGGLAPGGAADPYRASDHDPLLLGLDPTTARP